MSQAGAGEEVQDEEEEEDADESVMAGGDPSDQILPPVRGRLVLALVWTGVVKQGFCWTRFAGSDLFAGVFSGNFPEGYVNE